MQTAETRLEAGRDGRDRWRAGLAAGLLGAVAMMAFMTVAAALDVEADALDPLRAVGTSLRGRDASPAGPGPVAWGIVLHLLVGGALGVVLTALFPRDLTRAQGVVLGGGCALLWMALAVTVLLPRLAPGLHARMSAQGGAWVIAHVVFGAIAGLGPALRRGMAGRSRRRAPGGRSTVLRPRTST